jgi:uncharacterized RDD family membrane protein YckC
MSGAPAPDAPASAQVHASKSHPGILRRLAAMAYELALLTGVLFFATCLFLALGQGLEETWRRPLLQLVVIGVGGIYFTWFWIHGGQTLPMKTWHLRLVDAGGGPVAPGKALARYLLACVLIPAGGIAILWALVDSDRQFLHDRLAGTRIANARD